MMKTILTTILTNNEAVRKQLRRLMLPGTYRDHEDLKIAVMNALKTWNAIVCPVFDEENGFVDEVVITYLDKTARFFRKDFVTLEDAIEWYKEYNEYGWTTEEVSELFRVEKTALEGALK